MSEELIKRLRADNASLLSQVKISDEQWDAWNDRITALIAAGDKLAGFAEHDRDCRCRDWRPLLCDCGYTDAWKKWHEVRGE